MVASTDIKFYVHTNTSAPQLQNAFGCMIDVLDACLVNGFGSQAVSTLTANGPTVTVAFESAHKYMQYQVINIANADQSEFNGEHRILTLPDANTITFELAITPSVTTATGAITCSLPPLGWEKPFSSNGKAAYRSANTLLTSRPYLRVIDALDPAYTSTYAKYAKVGIVEDMIDIDTMLGVQAPYDSAAPDKNWVATGSGSTVINGWSKWYYSLNAASSADSLAPTAGSRQYIIVGNSDYFYILPSVVPNNEYTLTYGFGSFKSLLHADGSNNFLSSTLNSFPANQSANKASFTGLAGNNTYQKVLLQRSYNQAAAYKEAKIASLGVVQQINSGSQDYVGGYSLTNVALFAPIFINESVLRGQVQNLYWLFQSEPYLNFQLIEKNNELFIAVKTTPDSSTKGQVVLKIGEL